jgi:hypothetical protein
MAKRGCARARGLLDAVDFIAGSPRPARTRYAGSVPYLMLAGNLMAGWQMARALLVAEDRLAAGVDADFMRAKIATAASTPTTSSARHPACATASSTAPTGSRGAGRALALESF